MKKVENEVDPYLSSRCILAENGTRFQVICWSAYAYQQFGIILSPYLKNHEMDESDVIDYFKEANIDIMLHGHEATPSIIIKKAKEIINGKKGSISPDNKDNFNPFLRKKQIQKSFSQSDKILVCTLILTLLLQVIAFFDGMDFFRRGIEQGFFTFLRITTTISFAWLVVVIPSPYWRFILGVGAVLFNPIIKIHMDRDTWMVFDLIAFALLISAFIYYRNKLYLPLVCTTFFKNCCRKL